LALPAEAGASLPADNRIQWGGSPDDPIVEHIGERLRYFAWGRAPKVTNQSDPPAESAQPSDTKALRVLLWTPGLTGGGFTDPLAYTLTPEQIAKLVTPSDIDTGDARQLQMQISRLNEQLVNRLVPVDNSLIFINFMNRLRAKRTDSLTNRFFLLSIRPV